LEDPDPLEDNWSRQTRINLKRKNEYNYVKADKKYNNTDFSINGPFREKRVITSRTNWSKPGGANLLFKFMHT
jgi:hypothetical protein